MKKIKTFLVFFTLLLSLVMPSAAGAKPNHAPLWDDKVVIGGTFTLRSGETLDGNLVIIGGTVSLRQDSTVTGDVVLIGGNLSVEGSIQKDLVAFGGVLELGATAVVRGDLIAPGTVLRRDEDATVGGDLITDSPPIDIEIPEIPEIPELPEPPVIEIPEIRTPRFFDRFERAFAPVTQVLWFMSRSFAFSAVAVLFMLILPEHTQRVSRTLVDEPVVSGGFGMLSFIAAIPLAIVFTITIVLIPVTLLLGIVLALGLFMGWIAVGHELGRRMGESVGQAWTPAIEAGIGTFTLTFVTGSFKFVFWGGLGGLLGFLVGSIGLGAVLLTRFGSRDYLPASSAGNAAAGPEVAASEVPTESEEAEEEKPEPKSKTKTGVKAKPKTKPKASRKTPKKTAGKEDSEE